MAKKKVEKQELTDVEIVKVIYPKIQRQFATFGEGQNGGGFNPISYALKDKQLMFAMGVDVADVILFIIEEYKSIKK